MERTAPAGLTGAASVTRRTIGVSTAADPHQARRCNGGGSLDCRTSPALPPQFRRHRERVDLLVFPPGDLIAGLVQQPVVHRAQRHRVFVGDLPSHRLRLGEAKVVRLRLVAAADQARLAGDELQMRLVADAVRLGQRQCRLVDPPTVRRDFGSCLSPVLYAALKQGLKVACRNRRLRRRPDDHPRVPVLWPVPCWTGWRMPLPARHCHRHGLVCRSSCRVRLRLRMRMSGSPPRSSQPRPRRRWRHDAMQWLFLWSLFVSAEVRRVRHLHRFSASRRCIVPTVMTVPARRCIRFYGGDR